MGAPRMRWFDEVGCSQKKHYPTYARAEKSAKTARYRYSRAFHVYGCPCCKGWLIGAIDDMKGKRG